MATSGIGRHNRLCTILVKAGTPVARALFEKRVQDLRPFDQCRSTWTVVQFLEINKKKITSSKVGRNKRTIIYPIGVHATKLENWDLYLISSLLIECCELDSNIKLFITQLRKLRNKFFHMSEPTIDDDKYEHYLTKIKVIIEKCLMEINDAGFSEEINTMVKTLEEGYLQQNDIEDVMETLRSMQEETNDRLCEIGQRQQESDAKLDAVLKRLDLLTANIPALNTLTVPDTSVEIAINNCSKEKERDISSMLVDSFTELIKSDPVLNKDISELSTESQQKIKDAVYKTFQLFLSTGCKIVEAEEGCVRLTMHWTSLAAMTKFYQDCLIGKMTKHLHVLEEAVRALDGCEDIKLTAVVDLDAFSTTANVIVTMIENYLASEGREMQPSADKPDETELKQTNKHGEVTKEHRIGDTNRLKLRITCDHSENMEKLADRFDHGDVDIAMNFLQDTIRNEFGCPDLFLTTHLIRDCNSNKHATLKSDCDNTSAEFTKNIPTAIREQEETVEVASNMKQDIKLAIEVDLDKLNEDKRAALENPNLVIALDIGNYACGFAVQTRSDFLDDPLKIICNTKWATNGLCTYKTLTCLLLKPDKTLADFGYLAESKYNTLGIEDDTENAANWYFFKHFKTVLHNEESPEDDTPITDVCGKQLPVVEVFSKTIEYLKDQAVDYINQNGIPYSEADTKWVITVPGRCNEPAKRVMKHAAEKAGITSANLSIALEPECAAIYCSQLPTDQLEIKGGNGKLKCAAAPGSTIMVVDMGGGTVNITTVQINKNSTLKQVHMSGGGSWGGMKVDEHFMKMLKEIIGSDVMEGFAENFPMDDYELRLEFENRKREMKHTSEVDGDERIFIKLPHPLQDLYEKSKGKKIAEMLPFEEGPYKSVKFVNGRLSFHPDVIRFLFQGTVENILVYIGHVLKNPEHKRIKIDSVILVGGFAESNFVVQSLREGLGDYEIPVVRLQSAELAVLYGGAIFGHNEAIITSRIMPFTYGVAMIMEYDRFRHNLTETFIKDGKLWANNVFQKYVTKGQEIELCDVIFAKEYYTADDKQKSATVLVYSSDKQDPVHTTESGCTCIGSIEIDELATECDPDKEEEPWSRQRVVEVAMSFVGLNVQVKAISKILGKVYQKYLRIR